MKTERRRLPVKLKELGYSSEDHYKALNANADDTNGKATLRMWDSMSKNTSFEKYCKDFLLTDPVKAKAADEEIYELMKMEYDEFKRYKKETGEH